MQKIVFEVKFFRGPFLRTIAAAKCRAHPSPSSFTGEDVDEVLENVVEHLRKHATAFGDLKKKE